MPTRWQPLRVVHLIQVEGVEFAYPTGGFLLPGPDRRINEGENVAVTGPSGSRKTTLINLLSGIFPQTSGTIRVLRLDMARLGVENRQEPG